ncbi:metallophosphoesterase [Tianweitania sediminis]|uniref:Metallophosphoesterase n=1 Tax=Tianweitania sediminis TaxID=1502156 RepID=A0A8J7QZT0_9HYPH|nr:metallophosphoesterase [Tianweitania sediminis]MBP0439130.1 metallophosphoesterase [Tianweitania sediminis]
MAKLWLFSDLHLDWNNKLAKHGFETAVPEADVCVCAGDLFHNTVSSLGWLETFVLPHMPVVFVPGNHEYYGHTLLDDRAEYRQRYWENDLPEGLHYLDCDEAVVSGVRFLGATLWTDFEFFGGTDEDRAWLMRKCELGMNDYRTITYDRYTRPLTADHTRALHMEAGKWLDERLARPGPEADVVVTHHAPHGKSVAPQFEDDPLTAAYVSDLGGMMLAYEPQLWVHGHVHSPFDYTVGRTRVLCNPKGYPSEKAAFDARLVVEV